MKYDSDNKARKSISCQKCGSHAMNILDIAGCDECHDNGFYFDAELANRYGISEESWYYDEELRRRVEKDTGKPVVRDQSYTEGECRKGSSGGDGCWIFSCDSCGVFVKLIPKVTC